MDLLKRANKDEVISEFSGEFKTVLKPIKHRIPVDFLRDWQHSLSTRESISGEITKLHEASIKYLTGPEYNNLPVNDKSWSEAVVYITLHSLCKVDIVWMDGLPGVSLDNNIIPQQLILDKLASLYKAWGNSNGIHPCAKPYAFCMLTEAALKIPGYRISPSNPDHIFSYLKQEQYLDIDDYYDWGKKGVGKNINQLTTFVKNYAENDSPLGFADEGQYDLNHFKKLDLGRVNIKEKRNREIPLTILVAGLTGSGKTCLIKELYFGKLKSHYAHSPFINLSVVQIPNSLEGEIKSFTEADRPKPNVADCFELQSIFKIGDDSTYKLSLIDTRGGLLTEPPRASFNVAEKTEVPAFERNLENADLLLLVIDPETFFEKDQTEYYSQVIGGITARLNILFNKSHHAMIGIVFSKFDEYGLAITGSRRLIHSEKQADAILAYQKREGEPGAWGDFMDSILNSSSSESDPMKETLRELLGKIQELIYNIAVGHKHPVFNVYLTSVQLSDAATATTFSRSGLPMIFNDFERYMDWLINEAVSPNKLITGKHINGTGVELSWNNPYQESGTFIISRSADGKNFEKVGDFIQPGNPGESKYHDTKINNGKQYIYRLSRNEKSTEAVEVKVLTAPDPVLNISVELIPLNDNNKIRGVELKWDTLPCDYEVYYSIRRKEDDERKWIKKNWKAFMRYLNGDKEKEVADRWKSLKNNHRSTSYNDYDNLTSGSGYSYEITVSSVSDNNISSGPVTSETIVIASTKIPWGLIGFSILVIAIIIWVLMKSDLL